MTAFDQGLGRGDGVFESVAVLDGGTPHLQPHLAPHGRLGGPAGAGRPRSGGSGAHWWTPSSPAGPPMSRACAGLLLTRGLGEGLPPTALALLSPVPAEVGPPAHRRHLRGDPEPRDPCRLPRSRAVAARRGEDALLRGQHGRPAARSRQRRGRRRVHLPRRLAEECRRPRWSGPPAACCTPRRWRPGSCPAPRSPVCSRGPWTTAGLRPSPRAPWQTCTPPMPCGCCRGSGCAAVVHTIDGVPREDAGLTARVRDLLAVR